jgi:hypothetical protein
MCLKGSCTKTFLNTTRAYQDTEIRAYKEKIFREMLSKGVVTVLSERWGYWGGGKNPSQAIV